MNSFSGGYKEDYYRFVAKQIARKYKWLLFLAKKHKIQPIFLQSIVNSLIEIVHLKKEKSSINIGIVLESNQIKLESSPIKINSFHVSKASNFSNLRSSINGSFLCYIMDNLGMVTIGKLPSKHLHIDATQSLQEISSSYKTISFSVKQDMIEIFSCGELVQIYKKGKWTKPCCLDSYFKKLSKQGFPQGLIETVLNICKQLSKEGKGGIIVITKDDKLPYCVSLLGEKSFEKIQILEVPEKQLCEFACLDGAVVINTMSEIIGIAQQLDPPPSSKGYKELGRGTKHHSGADFSDAVASLVFVVSEDGPISLYFRGSLLARCFEELFGY